MLDYLSFDGQGRKRVTSVEGVHADMLMDITVYRLQPGQIWEAREKEKEAAVLLTEGKVEYRWEGLKETAARRDVFSEPPFCLHVCRDTAVKIIALEESEIIVQETENDRSFENHFYTPKECKIELMGEAQWEGTAKREVLTIFDYQNAPDSNMVMGEVITKAGRWSSYIPHSHPQPEVYYYKFEKPQGFGAAFIGDSVYKIADGSAAFIPGGLTHPQTAAPGYPMYYCWMIRHLENHPWKARENDPAHIWLLEE